MHSLIVIYIMNKKRTRAQIQLNCLHDILFVLYNVKIRRLLCHLNEICLFFTLILCTNRLNRTICSCINNINCMIDLMWFLRNERKEEYSFSLLTDSRAWFWNCLVSSNGSGIFYMAPRIVKEAGWIVYFLWNNIWIK